MASALRSVFLSNNESIRLYSSRSQLFSNRRRSQFWAEPNGKVRTFMVWGSTHRKMITAHKEFESMGSKCSRFFLQGVKIISSCRLRSIIPKGRDNIEVIKETTMVAWKKWSDSAKVAIVLIIALLVIPKADAVDALKTCTCLLKECRVELAKCIANPSCAANVACLQTCNNRPDETECQIKCGDLFANSVVDEFNECAVSRKKCVPQKSEISRTADSGFLLYKCACHAEYRLLIADFSLVQLSIDLFKIRNIPGYSTIMIMNIFIIRMTGAADYACFRGLLKQLIGPLSTQLSDRRSSIVNS